MTDQASETVDLRPENVRDIISSVERDQRVERFIPSRYPYTYAYDYLREHAQYFGLPHGLSRSDCAARLRGNPHQGAILMLLANAYLRQHGMDHQLRKDQP